jgi:hypothetical protein
MAGAVAGIDRAKGSGGMGSAGNIGRVQDGDGGTARPKHGVGAWAADSRSGSTAGDGGTGTAGMVGNGAWSGSGKGQIMGVAGGILRAKGNGTGTAVAEAVAGWGMASSGLAENVGGAGKGGSRGMGTGRTDGSNRSAVTGAGSGVGRAHGMMSAAGGGGSGAVGSGDGA